jgi:hypothetical protein
MVIDSYQFNLHKIAYTAIKALTDNFTDNLEQDTPNTI